MAGESAGGLGVSRTLQAVVGVGVLVWTASTVLHAARGDRPLRPREQMVYFMNPNTTANPGELGQFLEQGWRITHVSSAGAPQEHSASHRLALLLENPATKEQRWWFLDPYAHDGTPAELQAQLKGGFRIAQMTPAAATTGGGWTYRTVFVLER